MPAAYTATFRGSQSRQVRLSVNGTPSPSCALRWAYDEARRDADAWFVSRWSVTRAWWERSRQEESLEGLPRVAGQAFAALVHSALAASRSRRVVTSQHRCRAAPLSCGTAIALHRPAPRCAARRATP